MLNKRNNYPEPNGEIDFQLPNINKLKFKNKLPIYFIPKTNLPIVQVGLIINAGSKHDNKYKYGTAKLTSMTIDEGAGAFSSLELDNEFESLGTVFDISTDKDSTIISMLSLLENFEKSFELLSLILKKPHFNEYDFNREKEKLKTQLLQLKDEPNYLAHSAFESIIFKGTAYSNPSLGNIDSIENITVNDVKSFHNNFYNINNAELIVVGEIEQKRLMTVIENNLNDWKSEKLFDVSMPVIDAKDKNIFIIHREKAPQTEIQIGHISGGRKSSNFYAKSLMNTILGGQFTSRINLNLRENKGFTYGAHSAFSYNKTFGRFFVSTSVKTENTGESVSELIKELTKMQVDATQNEIDFAKSYLIKRFPAQFETYSQLVRNLMVLSVHSLPMDYFNNYVAQMNALSVEDVLSAAKNNLLTDKLTIVLVGDKNKIANQLDSPFIELDVDGNIIAD